MRRLGVVALLLSLVPASARAKPYYRPRDVIDSEQLASAATSKLTAAIRTRNTAAIGEVLGTAFTNNGMWFPDAACAKKFASGGEVKGPDVGVFARCLAQLKVQMSTRKPALRDGGMLTVDPGIEIELAFKGEQLRWVGFATQTGFDRAIPMLTAQAFEALRTQGTTMIDSKVATELDLELAKQRLPVLTTWIKVCLDPTGEIVKTMPMASTSSVASDVFLRAIADWKFQPFKVRGTAVAACALSLLAYPGAKAPAVETYPTTSEPAAPITRTYDFDDDDLEFFGGPSTPPVRVAPPAPPLSVPPTMLESQRIAGSKLIVPDSQTRKDIIAAGKSRVVMSMKMCLDERGTVTTLSTLKSSGFPVYDRKISGEMKQWLYRPYKINGKAIAVCTAVTFIYDASRPVP